MQVQIEGGLNRIIIILILNKRLWKLFAAEIKSKIETNYTIEDVRFIVAWESLCLLSSCQDSLPLTI